MATPAKAKAERQRANLVSEKLPDQDSHDRFAHEILRLVQDDLDSRTDWEDKRLKWYQLHQCQPTRKQLPWPGAANVCVPLLASANLQFQSRAYSAIFEGPYPHRVRVYAVEAQDAEKARSAEGVLNWQLMSEMTEYESEWDRMLMNLPIDGVAWTKVGWDWDEDRPTHEYIPGEDVIVPWNTRSVATARRITQRHRMHIDELEAHERGGFFEGVDEIERPGEGRDETDEGRVRQESMDQQGLHPAGSDDTENIVYETHLTWQFEGDEEPRPYAVWIEKDSKVVMRVVSREHTVDGNTVVMQPFTDYHFIPNPAGFYSFGFGHFIEPLNRISNTLLNQFIDAGRMANTPFAVVGRGAGLRRKQVEIRPGGTVEVNDLTQIQFTKFPGVDGQLAVLLSFIQAMSDSITSNSAELQGRTQKGVREPTVRGTLARIEQGLVAFGVLVKRVLRQQRLEIRKIWQLDQLFLPKKKAYRVLGRTGPDIFEVATRQDFGARVDLFPTGDPSFAAPQQKRAEAAEIMQTALAHPLIAGVPEAGIQGNPMVQLEILRDYLRTFSKPELVQALPEPPPPLLPPEVENQMDREGKPIRAKQGEAHLEHIASHGADLEGRQSESMRRHIEEHQRIQIAELQLAEQQAAAQAAAAEQPQPGATNGSAQPG